jgi:hypothetical protein
MSACRRSAGNKWRHLVVNYPVTPAFALPFRHFEFQHQPQPHSSPQSAHAFYCSWEDSAAAPTAGAAKLP